MQTVTARKTGTGHEELFFVIGSKGEVGGITKIGYDTSTLSRSNGIIQEVLVPPQKLSEQAQLLFREDCLLGASPSKSLTQMTELAQCMIIAGWNYQTREREAASFACWVFGDHEAFVLDTNTQPLAYDKRRRKKYLLPNRTFQGTCLRELMQCDLRLVLSKQVPGPSFSRSLGSLFLDGMNARKAHDESS